jgi:enoyl-CoA hydratase/carnithine racemase
MTQGRVIGRKQGPVGRLIFNHPEKRNAVSLDMARGVPEILNDFVADPAIRVIAISGAGDKSFVSGMDVSEFETRRSDLEQAANYTAISSAMYRAVRDAEKPTVAVIRGYCMGGGVAIACGCDLRICSDDSQFGIPAARLGIGYRAEYTQWVVEAIGPAHAKEMLITARRYGAAEAKAIGLVHAVASMGEFESACAEYLERIAVNAPLSMKAAKIIVNEAAKGMDEAGRERSARLAAACIESDDYKEGRRAFLEKRKPRFTGR